MTIALTSEKKQKNLNKVEQILSSKTTVRDLSSLLGSIDAFEAVSDWRLCHRNI